MVYSVDVYDKTGKVVETLKLNEEMFSDAKINKTLIQEYYLLQQANARQGGAHTKTRAEVAGSGKKLYRQKGTGNARVGDRRSPIRVGGGIAFGPRKERDFSKKMTKKARRSALYSLLTVKVQDNAVMWLKDFSMKTPSTKKAFEVLTKMGISNDKVLVVLDKKEESLVKSFRNLENARYLLLDYLNPVDLLKHNKVVFLQSALEKLNK